MKILVMGGTRFVGKSLVGKLLSKNYDIDIFTRGNKSNPEKTNLIKGDRNNSEDIVRLRNKKYDVVYDISGRELEQTKLLIENLDNSFQRYIYVSSAGVYKDNCELPLSEVDPIDPESRHKGKFETENWLKNQKIPFTSFRPTYIYGPGNYNKIENWFFERLFTKKSIPIPGDGSLITQLGHVSDLTDVMIRCINFENSKNNIYNCSGEKGVTIKGLIYFCANVLGLNQNEISLRTFDYQKLDPKSRKGFPIRLNHYQTDISKIKRDLEWAPTFDLFNGLKDSFVNDFNNKKSEEFDENSDNIEFEYFNYLTGKTFTLNHDLPGFEVDMIVGDYLSPYTMGDSVDIMPSSYVLGKAYPNPFNPTTTIDYSLSNSAYVDIVVYDITGKVVSSLISNYKPEGLHSVSWDASSMPSEYILFS